MSKASEIRGILDLHRAQLQGVLELRGVRRLRSMYSAARTDLSTRLGKLMEAGRGATFTAHQLRQVMAQLNDTLLAFDDKFRTHLNRESRLSSALAQKHLLREVSKLEQVFMGATPVLQTAQVAVLQGLYQRTQPTLLRRHKQSMTLYRTPVVQKIEERLALSLVKGETVGEAVDAVAGVDGIFEGQRWRAERITRTELAYSYGLNKQTTMEELRARDLPDLQKRLVATLDSRTGEDSIEVNGQTVAVDDPFVWTDRKGEEHEYMQPPNRPNDREVVIPWREGWPTSGTEPEGPVTPTTRGLAVEVDTA